MSHETPKPEAPKAKSEIRSPVVENVTEQGTATAAVPVLAVTADTSAETIQTVAGHLQRLPNPQLRTQQFSAIQQRRGNAYAARVARQLQHGAIQRHPPGTELLPHAGAADEQVQDPASAPAPETADPSTPATPAPAENGSTAPTPADNTPAVQPPAVDSADPSTPATPAPAENESTAPPPAVQPPAVDSADTTPTAPAAPTPAPATPVAGATLQLAYSQNALQQAFGGVAAKPIIQGNITIVVGEAAILAAYDTANIGRHNAVTNAPWVAGDAVRNFKNQGSRLNGFADAGRIWIDSTTTDPTTTVHEMLHINTASTFRATVGEVINEGMTERLAVQAVSAQGSSVVGSENTYAPQRNVVNKLIAIVGERTMQQAYFNGGQTFIEVYNRLMGSNSFTALKRLLDPLPPLYTAADAVLQAPSASQRIATINALLDWWVSDNDLTIVQGVFSAANEADRESIRQAIQPRITSLNNTGQRARLRAILGVV